MISIILYLDDISDHNFMNIAKSKKLPRNKDIFIAMLEKKSFLVWFERQDTCGYRLLHPLFSKWKYNSCNAGDAFTVPTLSTFPISNNSLFALSHIKYDYDVDCRIDGNSGNGLKTFIWAYANLSEYVLWLKYSPRQVTHCLMLYFWCITASVQSKKTKVSNIWFSYCLLSASAKT